MGRDPPASQHRQAHRGTAAPHPRPPQRIPARRPRRRRAGLERDPFSRGENNHGQAYNDLALILRDAAHVEKFRDLWRNGSPVPVARDGVADSVHARIAARHAQPEPRRAGAAGRPVEPGRNRRDRRNVLRPRGSGAGARLDTRGMGGVVPRPARRVPPRRHPPRRGGRPRVGPQRRRGNPPGTVPRRLPSRSAEVRPRPRMRMRWGRVARGDRPHPARKVRGASAAARSSPCPNRLPRPSAPARPRSYVEVSSMRGSAAERR